MLSVLNRRLAVAVTFLVLLVGGAAVGQEPNPVGSFVENPSAWLGTDVRVPVRFDNQGHATGYGPYLDVLVPSGSHLEFLQAEYLGQDLVVEELPVEDGAVEHPFHGVIEGLEPGATMLVIELPFGSVINGQPPLDVDLHFSLSPAAPLQPSQDLQVFGGFRFGADPLDNPASDEPLRQSEANLGYVTPRLVQVHKNVLAPDHDTPIGPTFRHTFAIEVDIAPGQTIADLQITDHLPTSLVYLADSLSVSGPDGQPVEFAAEFTHGEDETCGPGQPHQNLGPCADTDLVVTLKEPVGVSDEAAGPGRVTVEFDFYLALKDAVGVHTGADPENQGLNTAAVDGTWIQGDVARGTLSGLNLPEGTLSDSDQLELINDGPEHTDVSNGTIRLQKWVGAKNNTGSSHAIGDTVTFILEFQVSDPSVFGNVVIVDQLPDGLDFVEGSAQLTVSRLGEQLLGEDGHGVSIVPVTGGEEKDPVQVLTFDISDAMGDLDNDGLLIGACVPLEGGAPECEEVTASQSLRGTLTFTASVLREYRDTALGYVVQNDSLTNVATITGDIYAPTDEGFAETTYTDTDDGSATVTIASAESSKTVHAVGPDTVLGLNPMVTAGDIVTFELRVKLGELSFKNLVLEDFLPLPVFDVPTGQAVEFVDSAPSGVPEPYTFWYGSETDARVSSGVLSPTAESDAALNSIRIDLGSYTDPDDSTVPADIVIMLAVPVVDAQLADGLFVTNRLRVTEENTGEQKATDQRIVQLQYTRPVLNITNGIVEVGGNTSIEFTPVSLPDFSTSGTSDRWNPAYNQNVEGLDAGDIVTILVIVENEGLGRHGAWDVALREQLPSGLLDTDDVLLDEPLTVNRGDGHSWTFAAGEWDALFDDGLTLSNPEVSGVAAPVLGRAFTPEGDPVTDGSNILYFTYRVKIPDAENHTRFDIDSHVPSYAAQAGGRDMTDDGLIQDRAYVTISGPEPVKTIVATSEQGTPEDVDPRPLAIGEIVRYRLQVTIPEGTSTDLVLTDPLPPGLEYLPGNTRIALIQASQVGGIQLDSTLAADMDIPVYQSGSVPPVLQTSDEGALLSTAAVTAESPLTINLGTVTNDADSVERERIIIEFNAIVLDDEVNNSGRAAVGNNARTKNNSFTATSGPDERRTPQTSNTVVAQIEEPVLEVEKVHDDLDNIVDAGATVRYTITVSNTGGAAAYDLVLTDPLPQHVTLVERTEPSDTDTFTIDAIEAAGVIVTFDEPDSGAGIPSGRIRLTADSIRPDGSITLSFDVTLDSTVPTGSVVSNTATLEGANSIPEERPSANDTGAQTPEGGERTYSDDDFASFTTKAITLEKGVVATSEEATEGLNVVIGEVIRYRLVAHIPEGVNEGFRLTDTLPAGLSYIDAGGTANQMRIALVGHNIESSNVDLPNAVQPGTCGFESAPSPTAPVADSISSGPDGSGITFDLGDLTNNARDDSPACVIIEYNVFVDSSAEAGTLRNSVSGEANGQETGTATTDVTVIEPNLQIEKIVSSVEPADDDSEAFADISAGDATNVDGTDLVTFTVTISNPQSPGREVATAHDVQFQDELADHYTFVSGSYLLPGGEASFPLQPDDDGELNLDFDRSLAAEEEIVVTYTVRVDNGVAHDEDGVSAGETILNTARVTGSSLDPAAEPDAGKTGSDRQDPSEYDDSDVATVTTATPAIALTKDLTFGPKTGIDDQFEGVYEMSFRFVVSNEDAIPVLVTIEDDLWAAFAPDDHPTVTVQSAVVSSVIRFESTDVVPGDCEAIDPADCLTEDHANSGYSSDDIRLLHPAAYLGAGQSLVVTLDAVVQLPEVQAGDEPESERNPLAAVYVNQASATAVTPGGIMAEGVIAVEDVIFDEGAAISVVKDLKEITTNEDGTFDVTYTVTITNAGEVPLLDLSLEDDLNGIYGDGTYDLTDPDSRIRAVAITHVEPVAEDSTVELAEDYDGIHHIELLAAESWLAVGASQTLDLNLTAAPLNTDDDYTNTVTATGNSPLRQERSATSSVQHPFTAEPELAVALCLPEGGFVESSDIRGQYDVTLELRLWNLGDIQLLDTLATLDLKAALPDPAHIFTSSVAISSDQLTLNEDYDGVNVTELLAPDTVLYTTNQSSQDDSRHSHALITVSFSVVPAGDTSFTLQAHAEGRTPIVSAEEGAEAIVRASSIADCFSADEPPSAEDEPGTTTVDADQDPILGVAKAFSDLRAVEDEVGVFDIDFTFLLRNYGNVPLAGVTLIEDFAEVFNDGSSWELTAIAATQPLTAADPDGWTSGSSLLDPAASELGTAAQAALPEDRPGLLADEATVVITLRVTPQDAGKEYLNQVTGSGTPPLRDDEPTDPVTDESHDGPDPAPNEEQDPRLSNDPTPFTFETPIIGVAKSVPQQFDFGDGPVPNPYNLGDGDYLVGYVFTIVNYGDVPLSALTLTDPLRDQLSLGNPVSVSAVDGSLLANPDYSGAADQNILLDGQVLEYSEDERVTETVAVVVTLRPGVALKEGDLTLENQAQVAGTSPGKETVRDESNDGTDPDQGQPLEEDPENDGDGDPTNNRGPTSVVLTEEPLLALAKSLANVDNLGTGTYEVEFVFTLHNQGDVLLTNVQLVDDIGEAFRDSPFEFISLTAEAPLVAAELAAAEASGQLLDAENSYLPVDATATVTLILEVTPAERIYDGPFLNTAIADGVSPGERTVSDTSNDGTDPELGDDTKTEIELTEDPILAVAKRLAGITNLGTGTYVVDFLFTLENQGDVVLTAVQLFDDLDTTFRGSPFSFVSLTADAPLAAADLVTAEATGNLLDPANSQLAVGERATVTLSLEVEPGDRIYDGPFLNTAHGEGTSPGGKTVTDMSNDGLDPDPEDETPTPIDLLEEPLIGLAKSAEVTALGDGRYDVLFTFSIRNYGNVEIRNLQLTDDLTAAFGEGTYRVQYVYSPNLTVNSTAPDPSEPTAYDGNRYQNLLTGTDTLAQGASATVQMLVTVTPEEARTYENMALVSGDSPGGTPVEDESTDGDDPDPDGDDDPTNNNTPTLVPFTENPLIGLAKNAEVSVNADGSFNIELTFTVRNMGDVPLSNIQITDPLENIYAITDLSPDRISARSGSLTFNPAFDGSVDENLLTGTDTLPVGAERSITILLRDVRPTSGTSTTNSAVAHGESPTGTPTEDRSTDGFDPDPDGDGTPDEEVPTPIELERVTQIALAKRGALTIDSDGRTLTLEFTFNVANTGNVPLYGVRVSDDLAEYYANTDLSADMISVSSADLTVNPAFDGATDAHLLSGADSLAAGESGSITLTLAGFTANAGVTELANSALADGRGPDGTPTDDPSNDGDVPVPGEDVPTITPLTENPLLGVAKQAGVTVAADGTFTVTFDFVVGNYGNIELRDISLRDDLSVFWNAGLKEVSVSSDDFPVNSSFDGRTDTELLGAGATLAVGESGRLSLVLSGIDTPGNYTNQAIGEGESPTGTPTPPEYSTDGDDPDPNGDGTPDEDDPTPVTLESRPLLGLAKRATVLQNADLSYDVTFTIVVRNMGNAPLSGLQVTDDLSGFYADTDLSAADISVSSTDLSVNPGFNGLDDTALLTGTDTLAIGAESTVTIALAGIAPTAPVTLYNLAVGEGTPPGGEPVTDESTNGNNPDPNGDGDPAENEPTPVPLQPEPRIGIAKSAEVTSNADGSFDLVFSFVVGNYGNTELHNVQVRDDLSVFYGPTDISARHISLSSPDFTVNGGYDGLNDLRLLSGTDTLAIGESGTITMTITGLVISERVDTFNSAIATGTDPGGTPTPPDRSTDGDDPDPDGDGDPGNNNDPTPVVLGQQPLIGLAKAAETVSNGDGSYDITFTLLLRNYGEVPLFDLSLVDPLDEFYANTDLSAERVSVSSPTLAVNPAFDGASDTEVLAAGNSLAAGADATVTIVLSSVIPDAGVTALSNSALVSGTAPDGSTSSDISTDGDDPDPDGSGPGNHSDPTPVRFDELLAMLLDKEADPGPYQIGDRVSYTLTLINPTDTTQTVDLTDVTPAATEYISGTATIEPETLIPSEGSEPRQDEPGELSWRAIVLPPGETITVSYELRIRPGAESPLINTASIEGTGVSAQASASVLLEAGVFELERGLLIGRVYLDVNRNSRFDEGLDVPLPGARVVLANGWQTLTDEQGNYAFRDLESGTWAVMVDQLTTPYTPAAHPEQLRDPRQHRVQVQGVTVSDFPFESLAGLASTRRETTVSFGPIQLHKYHLPLGDTTRVVLEVTSADPWPPLLITDPLPGGGEREFTVELTGDEPVFLSYDLPAGVQLTDPSIEWSNR